MKLKLTLLAAIAALTGCAHEPFAYIDGNRYFLANLNTFSVIVLDVDGSSYNRNPVMVDPGKRVIRVQGRGRFHLWRSATLTLDVKPACATTSRR
jgi:hypothetical protein